jgi:hypothetical protein
LTSVQAGLKLGLAAKVVEVDVGKPFLNRTNTSHFGINNQFLLGLQLPFLEGRKPRLFLVYST